MGRRGSCFGGGSGGGERSSCKGVLEQMVPAVLKDACGQVERPGAEGVWRKAGSGAMWQRPGNSMVRGKPEAVRSSLGSDRRKVANTIREAGRGCAWRPLCL